MNPTECFNRVIDRASRKLLQLSGGIFQRGILSEAMNVLLDVLLDWPPLTIRDWNNLSVTIIKSENIDIFTNHLV